MDTTPPEREKQAPPDEASYANFWMPQATCPHARSSIDPTGAWICWDCGKMNGRMEMAIGWRTTGFGFYDEANS